MTTNEVPIKIRDMDEHKMIRRADKFRYSARFQMIEATSQEGIKINIIQTC